MFVRHFVERKRGRGIQAIRLVSLDFLRFVMAIIIIAVEVTGDRFNGLERVDEMMMMSLLYFGDQQTAY